MFRYLFPIVAMALAFPAAAADRPNVLFIAVDDLNDWVGPLGGHPQAKTPNFDRLAARGVTFANAHCQAPLCNSSRASILTGLRPSTTGVYALNPWFRTNPKFADHVTLPQHFATNGYRTLTTGKIFHDAYPPPAGRKDGTEFTVWGHHGGFRPRPEKKFVSTPDKNPLMDWGPFPANDEECFDYDVANWAIEQLRQPPKEPFFLSVGFRHPHVPCYAPQKWFDLYPSETLQLPAIRENDRDDTPRFSWYLHWKLPEPRLSFLKQSNEWRPLVRAYLASISYVDDQIGRVLDALNAAKLTDKTIIVLWSDHGWHLGEKAVTGKNTLWEESTRVPLIITGPGVAGRGKCRLPAELLDVYPTLADLCGLPAPTNVEGISLRPQLADPKAARERPAITTHGPNNHSVRTEHWRYIRYANGAEELYDHRKDPYEWTNLADQSEHAATKRNLARWLPNINAEPVAGSKTRLLTFDGTTPVWEGVPIGPNDSIPE